MPHRRSFSAAVAAAAIRGARIGPCAGPVHLAVRHQVQRVGRLAPPGDHRARRRLLRWYRDPLTKILFKGTFAKIGVRNLRWTNYASVTGKTPGQRDQMLQQTEQAFAAL